MEQDARQKSIGVLLINLGTPDSPSPGDVYRYLIEFLTDRRILDMSWLSRQLLVRGLIVPKRFRQSARCYQDIWTSAGSPLKVYGYKLKEALQQHLGDMYQVELAMRYQNPSIPDVLDRLLKYPLKRLCILPLFPQYASATTGSVHQRVMEQLSWRDLIPETLFINQYATHPGMIKAFCSVANEYPLNSYDHILFSFHGLPERQIIKADRSLGGCLQEGCCSSLSQKNQDCYRAQCFATMRAIATALNISSNRLSISFQSRCR